MEPLPIIKAAQCINGSRTYVRRSRGPVLSTAAAARSCVCSVDFSRETTTKWCMTLHLSLAVLPLVFALSCSLSRSLAVPHCDRCMPHCARCTFSLYSALSAACPLLLALFVALSLSLSLYCNNTISDLDLYQAAHRHWHSVSLPSPYHQMVR